MKIAICMSGHIRTLSKSYETLKKQILSKYDVDIYISTWNYKDNFYYENTSFDNSINEDYIRKILPEKIINIEIENYDDVLKKLNRKIKNLPKYKTYHEKNIIRYISMFYKNYKSLSLIKDIGYDLVIKIRPDMIYFNNFDISAFNGDFFYIPDQQFDNGKLYNGDKNYYQGAVINSYGYPDTFIYSNKENMIYFSDIYNRIEKYISEGKMLHPETLLKHHLDKKSKVIRTSFGIEILRSNIDHKGDYIHDPNGPIKKYDI